MKATKGRYHTTLRRSLASSPACWVCWSGFESLRAPRSYQGRGRANFMAVRTAKLSARRGKETEVILAACWDVETRSSSIQPNPASPVEGFQAASVKIEKLPADLGFGSTLIKGIDSLLQEMVAHSAIPLPPWSLFGLFLQGLRLDFQTGVSFSSAIKTTRSKLQASLVRYPAEGGKELSGFVPSLMEGSKVRWV